MLRNGINEEVRRIWRDMKKGSQEKTGEIFSDCLGVFIAD